MSNMGVLVRLNGEYRSDLSNGRDSIFNIWWMNFHGYGVTIIEPSISGIGEHILHFKATMKGYLTNSLKWSVNDVEAITNKVYGRNVDMYFTKFEYKGDIYEVLQGNQVDNYNYKNKKARSVCKDFMRGKQIKFKDYNINNNQDDLSLYFKE